VGDGGGRYRGAVPPPDDLHPGPALDVALRAVVAGVPGGGEERPGQLRMATAVADVLATGGHLVVQAGTGTGKSFGYLVPSVLDAVQRERRVVVATASKALQDQLAEQDLPALAERLGPLGVPVRSAVLKGRSNYICRQRLDEVAAGLGQGELDVGGGIAPEIEVLAAWAERTTTGDRAELAVEPSPRAWTAVSVSGEECPGAARCPRGFDCFAEQAKAAAEAADVVVVNLALYATHLASEERVLPPHEVVVFDEAHQLEDLLSSALGFELSTGRVETAARRVRAVIADRDLPLDIARAGDTLLGALAPCAGTRLTWPLPDAVVDGITLLRGRLERALESLRSISTAVEDADQRRARAQRIVQSLIGDLDTFAALDEGWVAWVPDGREDARVMAAPVEIGPVLGATVWGRRTAVLTSATIPPHFAARIGLPPEIELLDVGSPFDYDRNALLYCAMHLPDPRSEGFRAAVHDELAALIGAAGGRTLALFTSWRALTDAVEALRTRLPFTVLAQGEQPLPRLIELFRADETSCLFGTMGLFQGIDVPGAALSLVVIDRLPFPRPDDPLLQARRDRAGSAAFRTIDVARAATLLAQAAGRLVRTAEDRGVVAVLDPRLGSARYRWDVVRALPPFRRTRHRGEAEDFLRSLATPPPD
jgi:ATP-dependent DNA helicase DinG